MIRRGFLPVALASNFAEKTGVNVLSPWMWLAFISPNRLFAYLVAIIFAAIVSIFVGVVSVAQVEKSWGNVVGIAVVSFIAALILAILANRMLVGELKKMREAFCAFEYIFGYLILRCLPDAILPSVVFAETRPLSLAQFTTNVLDGIALLAENVIIKQLKYAPETQQVKVIDALLKGVLDRAKEAGLIKSSDSAEHLKAAALRLKAFIDREVRLNAILGLRPELINPQPAGRTAADTSAPPRATKPA